MTSTCWLAVFYLLRASTPGAFMLFSLSLSLSLSRRPLQSFDSLSVLDARAHGLSNSHHRTITSQSYLGVLFISAAFTATITLSFASSSTTVFLEEGLRHETTDPWTRCENYTELNCRKNILGHAGASHPAPFCRFWDTEMLEMFKVFRSQDPLS